VARQTCSAPGRARGAWGQSQWTRSGALVPEVRGAFGSCWEALQRPLVIDWLPKPVAPHPTQHMHPKPSPL
jgi:hypothetical protein